MSPLLLPPLLFSVKLLKQGVVFPFQLLVTALIIFNVGL